MTGGDPNKAEIEIDIVGDAVEKLNELAKAFESVDAAQERVTKNAERANRVTSSLARQRAQELDRHRKRDEREQVESERRKNRVTSGLARQKDQELQKVRKERDRNHERVMREAEREEKQRERRRANTPEAEARRRFAAGKREEMVQARLDAMTGRGKKTGLAGIAQAAEGKLGLKAGSIGQMAGRYAGPAAGMAAFAAAGKFGLDTAVTVSDQLKHGNPYADDFSRQREVLNNIPGADKFFAVSDLVTGRSQALGKVNRRQGEASVSASPLAEGFRQRLEQEREVRVARASAQNARSYAVPGASNIDRSTARGEQQYRLAQRLLPLEERRAEASRTRADAEAEHAAALEKVKKIETERDRISGENAGIDAEFRGYAATNAKRKTLWDPVKGEQGSPEYVEALLKQERNAKRMAELERERMGAMQAAKGTATGLAKAKWQETQAGLATTAERYQDLREREQTAGDRAAGLGRMGPLGQMSALSAMKMVETYKPGGVPQDVLATAESAFPEKVRKMLEAEGTKSFDAFRDLSAEDYRDKLPVIREQANKAQQDLQTQKQTANVALADDLASAAERAGVVGGESLGKALVEAIKQSTDFVVKQAIEELKASGMLDGYNLPVQR